MDAPNAIRISVEEDLCLGSRQCSFIAPDIFRHADDGTAIVDDVQTSDNVDLLIEAVKICPNFALKLEINGEIVHQGG